MLRALLTIDPDRVIGPVKPSLFGSFVEHMGRCVYGGVFDPTDPASNTDGFRTDVIDLTREMGVTIVRYPGGNFVSGYLWEDGVGPVEERPVRLDLAWRSIETNHFGLNEFMTWVRAVGAEPMMAANLGTRGVLDAAHLIEYCNYDGHSALADRRKEHGVNKPHAIKMWCLGNEMDGPWQIGHKTADEYGRLAQEAAKAIRLVDPDVTLVACGSSFEEMPTFGQWERTVLRHTFDDVDLISLHAYYEKFDEDLASFLASSARMNRFIGGVVKAADEIADERGSDKRINLSFDEWNVWYQKRFPGVHALDWEQGRRLIEDEFTVEDAVVVGSLLMTLLNNTDRVDVACQAQLVNVIGPIRTEPGIPAWRQTIFYPFALTAAHAKGVVLRADIECDLVDTELMSEVPLLDATVTADDATGEVALFILNRSVDEEIQVVSDLGALSVGRVVEALQIGGGDLLAVNTADNPERATPDAVSIAPLESGVLTVCVPKASWTMIRLRPDDDA